jgi:xylan 1,4-beta-xylosidase
MIWRRGARTGIDALAAKDAHHIAGIPAKQVQLRHYRIDQDHSNSYAAWKRMGSPSHPTSAQDGAASVRMQLPRQAVSLVTLTYRDKL